jgi:phage terminase large subunit
MARITPTSPQFKYINHTAKFPALVAGFGAGKTEAAVLRCIIGKMRNPSTNRGFYEPTYDLIRMIAWPRFEEILTHLEIPYKLHKTPLNYIDLGRHGQIIFRSMENINRIIGYEHADADIDELDTLKASDAGAAFRAIMARNRQIKPDGSPNTIGVTTTPEGFKFVYQTWKKDPKPDFVIIQAPTSSNPHLPADYLDNLKSIYPSQLLQAYTQGEFVNLTQGTVYTGFDRVRNNSTETIQDYDQLLVGMDFNVTNMSAVIYVLRGEVYHAVEELCGIYDTPSMITALKERYLNHNVAIYPDASGGSRKTVDASISDISLLESAGYTIRVNKKNPFIKDRVIATNSAFESGTLMINCERCQELAGNFEQLSYDANGNPDKTSGLDHLIDAATYPIAYELPINKPIAAVPFHFVV